MVLPANNGSGGANMIEYTITGNAPSGPVDMNWGGGNLSAPPTSGLGSIDNYAGPPLTTDLANPGNLVNDPASLNPQQRHWYDKILEKVRETVKKGLYDFSHPIKGIQDIIKGVTGINFEDGTFSIPEGQDASNFPNIDFHSDPTFKPNGINPLSAASNIPGFGLLAGAANLALQTANIDPTFYFGDGDKNSPSSPNTQYASNNVPATEFIPARPDQNIPTGIGGTQVASNVPAQPTFGLGSTGGDNSLGMPSNISPSIAAPNVQTGSANLPTNTGAPTAPVAAAAAYHPYDGDYLKYGQVGGEHMFLAKGGSVSPHQRAASRASLMAQRGRVDGPGTGKSDEVPAMLSAGEHVIPASDVSALGDGNTEEGHRRLELFKKTIRKHAGQKKPHKPTGKQPGLGSLMRITMGAR